LFLFIYDYSMLIRLAEYRDLEDIKYIFNAAKMKMIHDGNNEQWKDIDYPFCFTEDDIEKKQCYVIEDDAHEIAATFVFIIGDDPTYSYIEGGKWLNNNKYGTIHRIASNGRIDHVFSKVMDYVSQFDVDIRIDTHKDNLRMKHLIESNGFTYCGIIYVRDGTPRLAYQKEKK